MKKLLIILVLFFAVITGCEKKEDAHTKRYVYEADGKTSEEIIFSLDDDDRFITHISVSIIPSEELLKELAGSDDGDEMHRAYIDFIKPLEGYGFEKRSSEEYFELTLYADHKYEPLTAKIYRDHYTAEIDLKEMNNRDVFENDLLRFLSLRKYYNTTNKVMYFRPTMMRDDHSCLFFPAISQSSEK